MSGILDRRSNLDQNQGVDLLVVGGGIQGCGIAQAAAAAGYSTLLIEQRDWGSGTSSRSSKLIHGGLRYLESGQFSLVRRALRERQLLLKIAPKLVRPVPFLIPLYQHSKRSDMALYSGLHLYRWFGRGLDHNDFDRFEPDQPEFEQVLHDGLEQQGLRAIYRYWDAQTDDQLLTRAVAYSAQTLGAQLKRNCELIHAQPSDYGWRVDLAEGGRSYRIEASTIINATGPWVGRVQQRIHGAPEPLPISLVQGAHILVEGSLGGSVYYLETDDGRGVFAMPWQGDTLVGTTETHYSGDPAESAPTAAELDYLRDTLRRYFPQLRVQIKQQFAGLRVLDNGDGGFFHRARDSRIQQHWFEGRGLISIYGGKLTTYRTTALKVVECLPEHLGRRPPLADTAELMLEPA
ncbi:glycerol-3-phosphate dehydrogenase/oxidase [Motiliproteus coralliicola]|uniref:Glycerol-3-phosphate dehydrogenase/oxidase n=1 Tax=Motiliproteus coralliicola TaxID=2283196 RepID=A0A369WRU4_9GAMM|nr:glycerol-3-phosphate dehydrogenase/oxidase [Motiliproteus coralliicola]RDE24271.1 glycerol-3-phosphate dehydrogenase/oxidase [Motiliproteus coralliicola]